VTSFAVSWFNPVTVDGSAQLVALRGRFVTIALGRAVRQPILGGTLGVLVSRDAFAGKAEVDDVSHAVRRLPEWQLLLSYCNRGQLRRYGDILSQCGRAGWEL
jgi:hypothetical protein